MTRRLAAFVTLAFALLVACTGGSDDGVFDAGPPGLPARGRNLADSTCMLLMMNATPTFVRNDLHAVGLVSDGVPLALVTMLLPAGYECSESLGRVEAFWESFRDDAGEIAVTWLIYADGQSPGSWEGTLRRKGATLEAPVVELIRFDGAVVAIHEAASPAVAEAIRSADPSEFVSLWPYIEPSLAEGWQRLRQAIRQSE